MNRSATSTLLFSEVLEVVNGSAHTPTSITAMQVLNILVQQAAAL
jgi:hypothetical protein